MTPNKRPCSHPTCPDTHCRREGKPKRLYRIRKRSRKRDAQEREYREKIRPEYLQEHPVCEARVVPECQHHACQIHHTKGRIGALLNDRRYFLSVCDPCHKWIELNPLKAKELNLSVSRLNKAS